MSITPIFYISKVCLCNTNCHLYHKDPCPEGELNHSKVVIKKNNTFCKTAFNTLNKITIIVCNPIIIIKHIPYLC